MLQKKITICLLSAAFCMLVFTGIMSTSVMAQAPAPYTAAPATTVTAKPAPAPVATIPATTPTSTAALSTEQSNAELQKISNQIKRCAEIQDRSVRMTCYDNMAADMGFISPDRVKAAEAALRKIGFWQMSEKAGADGVKSTYLRVESSNMIEARNGTERQVALVIKCTPGKTDVFLDWKAPVVGGLRTTSATHSLVNYYTNNNKRVTENWEISIDKEAIFAPDAVAFVRNLMKTTKLTLEFVATGTSVQVAYFDTRGIDEAIDTIVKSCY